MPWGTQQSGQASDPLRDPCRCHHKHGWHSFIWSPCSHLYCSGQWLWTKLRTDPHHQVFHFSKLAFTNSQIEKILWLSPWLNTPFDLPSLRVEGLATAKLQKGNFKQIKVLFFFAHQYHSHSSQYRSSWNPSSRTGHHGHSADICRPAYWWYHPHHCSWLVPVSDDCMTSSKTTIMKQKILCVWIQTNLKGFRGLNG